MAINLLLPKDKRWKYLPPYLANLTHLNKEHASMNTVKGEYSPLTIGLSAADEYIENKFVLDAFARGQQLLVDHSQWIHSSIDQYRDWVSTAFADHHVFATSRYSVIVMLGDSLINIYIASTMATITIMGDKATINTIHQILNESPYAKAGATVNWVHNKDGAQISVPLLERPIIESAYPWCEGGVNAYIDKYLASNASILILYGPPGTGKTSFIRHMINRSQSSAVVAYDEEVMSTDSLFANWLESNDRFLCLEDSDAFLSARQDGNRMMHKFLNVSEGLVSVKGKKLIFSTNLPKATDIDEALMRPGRCFDVMHFRELTHTEALNVNDEISIKRPLAEGEKYTLASLFNIDEKGAAPKQNHRFGFSAG